MSAGADGMLMLWDVKPGRVVGRFRSRESVWCLVVGGGLRLVGGGALGLRVWNLEGLQPLRWVFAPALDTLVTADEHGLHVENRGREWRTLNGLPADPELDRYVGFVTADRRFGVAAYRLPSLLEWDDPKAPRRLTIRWRNAADRERFLGTVTVSVPQPESSLRPNQAGGASMHIDDAS